MQKANDKLEFEQREIKRLEREEREAQLAKERKEREDLEDEFTDPYEMIDFWQGVSGEPFMVYPYMPAVDDMKQKLIDKRIKEKKAAKESVSTYNQTKNILTYGDLSLELNNTMSKLYDFYEDQFTKNYNFTNKLLKNLNETSLDFQYSISQ